MDSGAFRIRYRNYFRAAPERRRKDIFLPVDSEDSGTDSVSAENAYSAEGQGHTADCPAEPGGGNTADLRPASGETDSDDTGRNSGSRLL